MGFAAGQKLRAWDLGQLNTTGQYQASIDQTIATGTDTTLAYATTNRSTNLVTVTAEAPGHTFTLLRAGLWAVFATERYDALATNERSFYMTNNTVFLASVGDVGSASAPYTQTFGLVDYFATNDVIRVRTFQNSGGNATRKFSSTFNWGRVTLCFLTG
jgi:hypothetical protein